MMSLSSPPVARYLPPQDHRTLLTQAKKRDREVVNSNGEQVNPVLV